MKILVLNGSPRPRGNTAAMVEAFTRGAEESGHEVSVVAVCQKKIAGCLGCEYCHTKGEGHCIQKDDMQAVYPLFQEAELLVLASPVYYFGFTGQLQCAISRLYAPGRSRCLKKTALMLSSGSMMFMRARSTATAVLSPTIWGWKIWAFSQPSARKTARKSC